MELSISNGDWNSSVFLMNTASLRRNEKSFCENVFLCWRRCMLGSIFSLANYLWSDFSARAPVVYPTRHPAQIRIVSWEGINIIITKIQQYHYGVKGSLQINRTEPDSQRCTAYQMSKRMCVIQRKWAERVCKNDSPCLSEVVRSP